MHPRSKYHRRYILYLFISAQLFLSSLINGQGIDTMGMISYRHDSSSRKGYIVNRLNDSLKGSPLILINNVDTIRIDSLIITNLNFENKNFDSIEVQFNYDSIYGEVEFIDTQKYHPQIFDYFYLDIEDCYLDNNLNVTSMSKMQNVTFNYCTFNNKVRRIQLRADTVRFINCKFSHGNITLEILPSRDKVFLELYRTDIDNIRFIYPEGMELIFIRDTAYEIQKTIYQKLLSKFKNEGKDLSYKWLDIDYQLWDIKHKKICGKICTFLNKWWWNFGYSKGKVFVWTLSFLLLFYIINLSIWEKMHSVYPIISVKEKNYYYDQKKFKQNIRHLVNIFVFTALIFFSLKIDFDKLSFKSSGLLLYFFMQYIVGLICLFFIVNAILKF